MKKMLIKSVILIIMLMTIETTSKAAIENKPGGELYRGVTVSEAYQLCFDMKYDKEYQKSPLGNNSLQPHLTTNADWGAVAYLSVTPYGVVNKDQQQGATVQVPTSSGGTVTYTSTTGNITGIMNMGTHLTQTAALKTGYTDTGYITNLKNNIGTKYVETLGYNYATLENKGRAFYETSFMWSMNNYYMEGSAQVCLRNGVLGWNRNSSGNASDVTFRPVIWN